jgi:phosphatidylethanolamine-binding protein (PEBP) family uncharacterized protein
MADVGSHQDRPRRRSLSDCSRPGGPSTGVSRNRPITPRSRGANGFGQPGYLGPAPPAGHGTHYYVFRLLALDQPLKINGQPSYAEVEEAAAGDVIAEARLVGTYETPPSG